MRISRVNLPATRATTVAGMGAGVIAVDRGRRRVTVEEARVATNVTIVEDAARRRAGVLENRADLAASGTIAISVALVFRSRRLRARRW